MHSVPIGVVSARLDIPISTLHYWERCGLIAPRRDGQRRVYDSDQVHRIALIQLWRDTGMLSIDEIATVLAGRTATHDWRDTVAARIAAIDEQTRRLDTARDYLSHLLGCPREHSLEDCPDFRRLVAPRTRHLNLD